MRLDVAKSPVLAATVRVMATMPTEAAKVVRKYSKSVIVPEYRKHLAERAPGERVFHERLVKPSNAIISNNGVKLVAGSNRAGMFPRETDFGAYREEVTEYTRRSPKGVQHIVKRRTQRQFWHFVKGGRVFYPTVENMIPRIGALWVQSIYRTVADSIEKAIGRG